MKERGQKTKSLQLRITEKMYAALVREAEKRECSIPEVIRHATRKFYRIGYQESN